MSYSVRMTRVFYIDPSRKLAKPCAEIVLRVVKNVHKSSRGLARSEITVCVEIDYDLVEVSVELFQAGACLEQFELGDSRYRGKWVAVVNDDNVTSLPVAFV